MPTFEDLDDGRLLAGAIGGDRVLHRGVVGALAGAVDLVVLLGGVEVLADFLDPLADIAAIAVPEIDLHGIRECRGGKAGEHPESDCGREAG